MIPISDLQIPILVLARDRHFLAIDQPGLDHALEALRGGFEQRLAPDASDVDVDERDVADGSTEDSRGFAGFSAVFVTMGYVCQSSRLIRVLYTYPAASAAAFVPDVINVCVVASRLDPITSAAKNTRFQNGRWLWLALCGCGEAVIPGPCDGGVDIWDPPGDLVSSRR